MWRLLRCRCRDGLLTSPEVQGCMRSRLSFTLVKHVFWKWLIWNWNCSYYVHWIDDHQAKNTNGNRVFRTQIYTAYLIKSINNCQIANNLSRVGPWNWQSSRWTWVNVFLRRDFPCKRFVITRHIYSHIYMHIHRYMYIYICRYIYCIYIYTGTQKLCNCQCQGAHIARYKDPIRRDVPIPRSGIIGAIITGLFWLVKPVQSL